MSSVLMRTSEIAKRPVVTFEGEDVAQIKDVIYAADGGQVEGFTLNGRGRFAGPLKTSLAWSGVSALGPDAVMIADESALVGRNDLLSSAGVQGAGKGGDVLGSQVLTDDGTDVGKVIDVIIEVNDINQGFADVVGYEIEPSAALGKDVKKVLIPLPDTIAASGEHLIVPAAARDFVSNDLAGFGASVADFRSLLRGRS